MNYVVSQFAHPRGPIGRLVGMIMAYENRERNAWAVSLLKVQPSDRVLEIGFGPGWAIGRIAALATAGFVAGVDHSQTMVHLATERNAAAVRERRVALQHGSALALPYEAESFTKVLAVNSLHHWPDALAGLHEALRVLMPGGVAYRRTAALGDLRRWPAGIEAKTGQAIGQRRVPAHPIAVQSHAARRQRGGDRRQMKQRNRTRVSNTRHSVDLYRTR